MCSAVPASKTGGKALKAANVARVLAGAGGALEIVDVIVGIHGGRMDKSLVQADAGADRFRLHETMRQNGFRYVDATYRWPVIMDRYGTFLEEFVARRH